MTKTIWVKYEYVLYASSEMFWCKEIYLQTIY